MGVARINQRESVPEVIAHQCHGSGVCATCRRTCLTYRKIGGILLAEREQPTLEVVVKAVNHSPAVLPPELDGVPAAHQSKVVKNLESLAGAPARNAEPAGSQILKDSAEINLRQAQLATVQVKSRP